MKEPKWFTLRARYIPALWPIYTYYQWDFRKFVNMKNTGRILHIFNRGESKTIFERPKFFLISKNIAQNLIARADELKKIRNEGLKDGDKLIFTSQKMAKTSPHVSVEKFITFMNQMLALYPKLMESNVFYWSFGSVGLEAEIEKGLKKYNKDEIAEIFATMSIPSEISYSRKLENEFELLVKLARNRGLNSASVKKKIKDFSKKYFWFPYEYVGPKIWDEKSIKLRIKDNLEHLHKEVDEIDVGREQKQCIKKFNLSNKIVGLFKILQLLAIIQDDRKEINSKVCYYFNGVVVKELAKKLGIPWSKALYLDQELLRLNKKDKKLFLKRIDIRTDFFVAEYLNGKSCIYEGETGKKYLESLGIKLEIKNKNNDLIKGQIANKGIVRGRVRVLKTSQVSDFKNGEIIVTGMTTPDFTPLIKKAAAIITDEGGITCHAAIVSRELNKPCITGTKIATQVLRDGDLVEVDANMGIIKIIKN